jgi:hypothetical protein
MSEKSAEFRGKAALCEQSARQARDPEVKRQFEELARSWQQLAEQADRVKSDQAGDE